MKLVRMQLFCIEYAENLGSLSVLIEATDYAEAERLFKEEYKNRFPILSITKYKVPVFKKVTKTITVEL